MNLESRTYPEVQSYKPERKSRLASILAIAFVLAVVLLLGHAVQVAGARLDALVLQQ